MGSLTIRSGDTLSGIAQRCNVSVAAILRANPSIKDANRIYAGQTIEVPGWGGKSGFDAPKPSAGGSGTYTVRAGDTLSEIGARFGVSYQTLASLNGLSDPNRIHPGQVLKVPGGSSAPPASSGGGSRYTVQPGDTLSAIGARFGVSWASIAQANGISNPNRISPGQSLTIPGATPVQVQSAGTVGPVPGPTSGGVSVAQLRAIMPNLPAARAEQLLPYLNDAMAKGGIDSPLRKAAFLAQLAHESVGLTAFEEFASGAAYEGRKDLGNINPGDGVRYKGRGPIQLTGRNNYRAAGNALGIDLEGNPARAADLDVGFRTAVWFWNSRDLSSYADARNFDAITLRINGGYNGKAARDSYYARALSVLGG